MAPNLPRVVQRPTVNYTPVVVDPDLLVLHIMEGGYAGSVAWLCQRAADASVKLCMNEDGTEVSQLLPLGMKSWGQCAFNGRVAADLELPGFTAQGIPEDRWRAAAVIFGYLCVAYDIPAQWAQGGEGRGICQHADLGQAGGGHHDCSGVGSPTWLAFVQMVAEYREQFAALPELPPFALHGLPNPHHTELPPNAIPTPTHGGAARIAPDELSIPHPTPSGYPAGSVCDLQGKLNRVGANPPLKIDGVAGNDTRGAIKEFQEEHGLNQTGVMDWRTWSALNAAVRA